jgi:hypothetical protein
MPCHAMHPIQDLFLESFSYELQLDMHSYLHKNFILAKSGCYKLEHKFHEHFYSPDNEFKLSDLTSVRQVLEEYVHDYIRRFRDTKNDVSIIKISELFWLI